MDKTALCIASRGNNERVVSAIVSSKHSRTKLKLSPLVAHRGTYINCPVVENRVRDADRSIAVITAADWDNAISLVCAERIEDRRQRTVS